MATPKKTKSTSKNTSEHLISKKRSGRFMVRTLKGKIVNGMDKTRILVAAKLVQAGLPKSEAAPSDAPATEEAPTA